MEEQNKESTAFKELLGLESMDQGIDFSMLEDSQKKISTDSELKEDDSKIDKKSAKKFVNFLIDALKKL